MSIEQNSLNEELVQNDSELEKEIYSLLYDFAFSVAIYHVIRTRSEKQYDPCDVKEHFWNVISDNCLQQAIVDWCKVFGAKGERTYYTKINTEFVQNFEQAMKEEGINFIEYSTSMKNVRDKFIYHRDEPEQRKPIPKLDQALIICDLYERKVICGNPMKIPFGITDFYMRSKAQVSRYMDLLGIDNIASKLNKNSQ